MLIFKEASGSPVFHLETSFPAKGKFSSTCNSVTLGEPNEQYFNFKILANYQEGGFLPGSNGTISVMVSYSLFLAYLWRRHSLRHSNNGFFFSADFHYFGFLSVTCPTSSSCFQNKVCSRKMGLQRYISAVSEFFFSPNSK